MGIKVVFALVLFSIVTVKQIPVLPEVTFCDLVFNAIFNLRFYIYLNSESEYTSLAFCKFFQDQ